MWSSAEQMLFTDEKKNVNTATIPSVTKNFKMQTLVQVIISCSHKLSLETRAVCGLPVKKHVLHLLLAEAQDNVIGVLTFIVDLQPTVRLRKS